MPAPRTRAASPPAQVTAQTGVTAWLSRLRPDMVRWSVPRIAMRAATFATVVAVMTVAANWHASGKIRSGEIHRMMRMSAKLPTPVDAKARGRLDKARLEALAAAAAR